MIANSDLLELGMLLLKWARRVRTGHRPPKMDFTFTLHASVSPSCILGHEHPELIKDPLLPMQPCCRYESPSNKRAAAAEIDPGHQNRGDCY